MQHLRDFWEEVRGFGWLDKAGVDTADNLAKKAEDLRDALQKEMRASGYLRHAVEAGARDALESSIETVVAQLRGLTAASWVTGGSGQRAPGRSSRVRLDELLLVEEATDVFHWAHPDESLGLTFDPNTNEPANAYTEWIADVLVMVGVKRKPRTLLQHLREHENRQKKWDLGHYRQCSEAERRELDAWHQEVLRNYVGLSEAEFPEWEREQARRARSWWSRQADRIQRALEKNHPDRYMVGDVIVGADGSPIAMRISRPVAR